MTPKSSTLVISPELALPTDFATKSTAILAQRRKGKTYAASVIAEECVAAEVPFVALDPTGAWWGLRASADGKREGLPVYVFGGEHPSDPELRLERGSGKLIAEFVVDFPGYYVVDFKGFDSKEAERQFATDFAERLYRYKGQPGKDFVMHLFVDEADMFVPQRSPHGDQRMLGAFESIVRRGGIRGLGTSLISQRSAVVNKNVLEQIDILFALRTVGPNDQKAIRNYVRANGSEDEVADMLASLASLPIGEAWVYEPGGDLFERIHIRERRTFNSSATPKAGEKRVEPKQLADVELAALRERMADTIQRAKADDPKELRKTIRRLEADLRKRPTETVEKEKLVEVPVEIVPDGLADELEGLVKMADRIGNDLSVFRDEVSAAYGKVKAHDGRRSPRPAERDQRHPREARRVDGGRRQRPEGRGNAVEAARPAPRATGTIAVGGGGAGSGHGLALPKGERIVLTAIAQHAGGVTREQLTILTGYKRSSRDTYIQRLREKGLIDVRDRVLATGDGVAALGDDFEPLPTGEELRTYWLGRLPAGEKAVLEILIAAHPNGVSRDEISERTEYRRSSRDTYIQRLRARELVVASTWIYAADALFDEGGT